MRVLSQIIEDQAVFITGKDKKYEELKISLLKEVDSFIKEYCPTLIFTTTRDIKNPYKKLESENFQYWLEGDCVILTNKYYRS